MSTFVNFPVFLILFLNFFPIPTDQKHNFTFLVSGGYRPNEHTLVKHVVSIRIKHSTAMFGITHFCGGSIISNKLILTAGHCLWKQKRKDKIRLHKELEVVAGTPNRLKRTSDTQVINVKNVIVHPEYEFDSMKNDIGVLVLASSITEDGRRAQRIELPHAAAKINMECTVVGWGNLFFKGPSVAEAMYADIYIINPQLCQNIYKSYFDGMLCAGDLFDSEKDTCRGDSGGPLICENKIYGIVSFGPPCGILPGIYTNVSHYRNWLLTINGASSIDSFQLMKILSAIFIVWIVVT